MRPTRIGGLESICSICGVGNEDILHALIRWPNAAIIWHYLTDSAEEMDSKMCINFKGWWGCKMSSLCEDEVCRYGVICWGIWRARNKVLYANGSHDYNETVGAALSFFQAFEEVLKEAWQSGSAVRDGILEKASWQPPSRGKVKINCDAGFVGEGVVSFGFVIRDENGDVLVAATHQERAMWEANIAEAKAINYALRLALSEGFDEVEVETDCLQVVHILQMKKTSLSALSLVVNDALRTSELFRSISWNHVKRNGNVVAHLLAKHRPIELGDRIWVGGGPVFIEDAVADDICNFFSNK